MFAVGQHVSGPVAGTVIGIVDAQGYSLYVVAPYGWEPMSGVELEGFFADELR